MLKKLLSKFKTDKLELAHLRRFTNALSWLAGGYEEVNIKITKEVTISVFQTADGQRIRLCETTAGNVELAMLEAITILHNQKGCCK